MRVAAVAMLLAMAGCGPAMPEYDPGGSPDLALARVETARERGAEVAIRGVCFSACALKLSASRLCVSPSAQIGVHEVRRTSEGDYEHGTRDEMRTAFFAAMLPQCARTLFAERGGFRSGRLVTATGLEVLAACPEIKRC